MGVLFLCGLVYNGYMKKITPYSDDKMLYNKHSKQYELNISYIKSEFGNPYADDGVLQKRINRNTRKVYNYIFATAHSANRKIITAIISHTEEYRKFIFEALLSQMEADLSSGYNDQSLYAPKDFNERNLQYINEVSVDTKNIIDNCKGFGGINLISAMLLPTALYIEFMGYM